MSLSNPALQAIRIEAGPLSPRRSYTAGVAGSSSPWQKSRGRCLGLFPGLFVVETPRISLQYSSFLRLDAGENPRRIVARDFSHGLLG